MSDLIPGLKKILSQPLPGIEAQYRMAPLNRERISVEELDPALVKESAVMVLLLRERGELYIPLIERPSYEGFHSGQISLPGGKRDLADESLQETALRECFEEIGIRERVEVLGRLTSIYIPVSNYLVVPYVGVCTLENPLFVPHAREVSRVLKLPLAQLLDDRRVLSGMISLASGLKIDSPYFEVDSGRVWGATAMILSELKEIIKTIT